jgi:hypothetical protein
MSRKVLIGLCAALAVFAFGTMTVGSASGANMKIKGNSPGFLAVYGFPAAQNEAERPVGDGLGRNFGFGQNMLFQAGGGGNQHSPIGVAPFFEINSAVGVIKSESCDAFVGGTLMSNRTGKDNPLSFSIQFADFQCTKAGLLGKEVLTQTYADTQDQHWITEICSPEAGATCKPDAVIPGNAEGQVKIEHVALDLGPGLTLQGVAWGTWENGKPPCIKLKNPPAAAVEKEPDQTLIVTRSVTGAPAVGEKVKEVKGTFCLISANNDWYQQSEKTEPTIEIANE